MIYAYLRKSTDHQDFLIQKHGVLEYANDNRLTDIEFVEDSVTSRKNWKVRGIGQVLRNSSNGDTIIANEISRLARSTLEILEILHYCTEKKINLRIVKNKMLFDNSMQSKITATVLGLAAEIEREFISSRTKEALAARKAAGLKLGRPKGKARKLKLDTHQTKIQEYLDIGVSKVSIAKIIGCPPTTLYDFCKARKIKTKARNKNELD